ncbi:MAG: heme exporter protein CcmD [Tateyamaria sp.]|nr:heme exporter protein CcmD [Tateyamaria sp.]MBT5301592.1 heme exporter protein CcmD [Tateyamaria sp.]MBT6268699.1 heme exporter protein CcmD [Tateyamaria sp.]MBT6343060.1 heme exporter protein CcmD [Tateyamaria sp.]MBT7448281.1 heme exporter protein CcmD [Tateyamaria sp.]
MPDLGKYADTVLWAYAASLLLLLGIVILSLWRGHRIRLEMQDLEGRIKLDG